MNQNDNVNDNVNDNTNDNTNDNVNDNTNDNILWLEKYRPKTLSEYLGNKDIIEQVKDWITKFKNKDEKVERFLLLHGKPGIGKTTLAHIIFNEYNYDIVEINASEQRSKKKIHERIGVIGKYSILFDDIDNKKQVGLIMEEIDGSAGGDKGSIDEMINIVIGKKMRIGNTYKYQKKLKYPIICTCNSIKDRKLQSLIKESLVIKLPTPDIKYIRKLAKLIIEKENIIIKKTELNNIVDTTKSDYRSLINSLKQYKLNNKLNFLKDLHNDNLFNDDLHNSPLDKINYFLNNKNTTISQMLNVIISDENVFFLNLHNNYINILNTNSYFSDECDNGNTNRIKKSQVFYEIIDNICVADTLHHFLFENLEWQISSFISIIGVISNIILLRNLTSTTKLCFLTHHNSFNRMCQEDGFIKRKRKLIADHLYIYDPQTLYYIGKNVNLKKELKSENISKELGKICVKIDNYLDSIK